MSSPEKPGPTLSIVLPALDEEEALGRTLERCLEARAAIREATAVAEVEILVVSDGSRDRTEEIALGFPEVAVLAFDRNRGYGAAIKAGFAAARGDWLAFLDADGTCDPRDLAGLCLALEREGADLVLGSRLGPDSRMPRLRSLGNRLFAWLLGVLSQRMIRDTASGMRVLRREAFDAMAPLPDGLHFTPAMSARALLEDRVSLVEVPVPYAERSGRSKLSVVGDGLRFLSAIVQTALVFQPDRPLLLAAAATAGAGLLFGALPLQRVLTGAPMEEWLIYRVLMASLLLTLASSLAGTALVADRIAATAHDRPPKRRGALGAIGRALLPRWRRLLVALLLAAGVVVVWPGIVQWLATGQVTMHWARAVLGSLLVVQAAGAASSGLLVDVMALIRERRAPPAAPPTPDRVRPAAERP